jgi:hypothetical protein
MENSAAMPASFDFRGFKMAMLFPVDWPTAIVELLWNGETWAYVSLDGVDYQASGAARTRDAMSVVQFWGPIGKRSEGAWQFDFLVEEAVAELAKAKAWLLENEGGRRPGSDEGMTAAGAAFSKMSEDEQRRWRTALDVEPDEEKPNE